MFNKFNLIIIYTFLVLFYPAVSSSSVIEGIVFSEKGPVESPTVYAYKEFRDIRNANPSYISTAGTKKGFYTLQMLPGKYYLVASGMHNSKDYFSFHGANPIEVKDKNLWLPFMAVQRTKEIMTDHSPALLSGKVTFRGSPVANAQVSIYSPADDSFRGMGFLTGTTDDNGQFRLMAEPGEYVIIARKRNSYSGVRPLTKGDLFCYFSGNPATVMHSKETDLEIPCYPRDNIEAFLDKKVYSEISIKKSARNLTVFQKNNSAEIENLFSIKGRVTDLNGKPLRPLYVMAYKGKPLHMFKMLYVRTMPEYIAKTDENGYYTINAKPGNSYYLVAREFIGKAPVKNEYYGLYENNANHTVGPVKGSVAGADIAVSKIMTEETQDPKINIQYSEIRNRIYTGDTIINKDTAWNGYIVIDGTVHVARGSTLTIRPGTVVFFKKTDRNLDGVGDGKITVSGRILAKGTPDNMITFTSAEANPDKMDWSYLLLFVSRDENVIKHCIFNYAFTGVQVHFSKAIVSDSIFTKNHEGIRFGRAELQIEHNDILNNSFGIRYTRLEGPVKIIYNNISNNEVGIFHVPSNQNIVDFSETSVKKESFHRHQPVVRYNNIAYNDEYNFRLGERQGYNILLKDNWWGSAADNEIQTMIYDEQMDSSLGRAVYKPYYRSPVEKAGVGKGE